MSNSGRERPPTGGPQAIPEDLLGMQELFAMAKRHFPREVLVRVFLYCSQQRNYEEQATMHYFHRVLQRGLYLHLIQGCPKEKENRERDFQRAEQFYRNLERASGDQGGVEQRDLISL
ncbi:Vpr protein [SIV-wrc Pbt-05GM-X02]|uniref:Vpr protein n=1 Tax=SIV-wrc Pbt-05GM-X02 TaxID=498715 RepID=B3CKH0_SIV|nr:Vpr protein [SIV-wrc Pbt-05GM-X02]